MTNGACDSVILSDYLCLISHHCPDYFQRSLSTDTMAATMAAALAASLPAPQAAPVPVAPTYEAIPASMSKLVDTESEIPLSCVQLDGLVRPTHSIQTPSHK